jgi:hypothetical protein
VQLDLFSQRIIRRCDGEGDVAERRVAYFSKDIRVAQYEWRLREDSGRRLVFKKHLQALSRELILSLDWLVRIGDVSKADNLVLPRWARDFAGKDFGGVHFHKDFLSEVKYGLVEKLMGVASKAVWTSMLTASVDIDVPTERELIAWPTCEKRLAPGLNDLDFLSGHSEEKGSAIEELFNFQQPSLDFFQVFLYTACCNDTTFLSCCQVEN